MVVVLEGFAARLDVPGVVGGFRRFVVGGDNVVLVLLCEIQHGIGLDGLLDLGPEFQRRELHEADCLLQLRRHGQLLAHPQRQRLLHHSSNISPR